jgi:hypothetical protein
LSTHCLGAIKNNAKGDAPARGIVQAFPPQPEHDPQKACPELDPSWKAAFRKAQAPPES